MAKKFEGVRSSDTILGSSSDYHIKYAPYGASLELFHDHSDEICLVGPAGCLASSTRLVYNRGNRNSGRDITIENFYLKFNGLAVDEPWIPHIPTYLHSLGEDSVMFYNRVVAVYQSGEKPLITIEADLYLPLSSTYDHPFMTPNGWVAAGDLKPGMKLIARGPMLATSNGGRDLSARPPRVIVNCKYHPYGNLKIVSGYPYKRLPRARLVVEASLNGLSYDDFVHILKHCPEEASVLQYLQSGVEVHHEDENTLNDDIGNLYVMSKASHARHHNQKGNFRFDSTREVEIRDVRGGVLDMTYDIQMEDPSNNFCANGLIVHNTGKSLSSLQKLHLVMTKYPMAKAFMARKTRQSMTNSCIDMFQRHVLRPPDKVHFHKTDQQFNYPNGSLIAIVGLDDPERIKSTDWDVGYVQEVTECTENDWEIATTRLRNWIVPYQQAIADCNPDKPTHWMKKRIDRGLTKGYTSRHEDNPRLWDRKKQEWTDEGKKYLAKLSRLSGPRRSRLYKGLWVAAEGIVYEKWEPLTHMISLKELPEDWPEWPHYWAFDWGHTHPMVWQDWIENPRTHQLVRLQEFYHTKQLVEDFARWLAENTSNYRPRAIICDHDAEDRAILERHLGSDYLTLAAYKSIQAGIQAVTKRLEPDWCEQGPGILFVRDALVKPDPYLVEEGMATCTEMEFDGYVWDAKLNREVNSKKDELPVDKDNHGMDATRYMVAFHDNLADDPEDISAIMMLGDESEVRISPY